MRVIQNNPRALLLALLLAVVAVGHRAPLVLQDNSPEALFATHQDALTTYHKMVRTFGSDEVVMVQLRGARLDRARDVDAVARLARHIAMLPGVQSVSSVADALPEDVSADLSRLDAPTGAELSELMDDETLAALGRETRAVTMYRKLGLVRPSVPALAVAATVTMGEPTARARLTDELHRLAAAPKGYTPLVAGLTPANAAIDRETRRSLMTFLPLTAVLMLVVGLVLFRSPGALLAMFLPTAGATLMGLGALELAGEPMNMVTSVMPPLVLCIGFAGAVHLTSHYGALRNDGLDAEAALGATLRDKLVPTAFAFVTTAVGFGSLWLSDVHAIQVLGALSAGSLLAALVLVTLGTPALLLLLRPRIHSPRRRRALLRDLALWSLRRRPWVLAVALAAAVPAGLGLAQLEATIDGMEILGDQVPEKRAFRTMEAEGLGLNTVDVWIRGPVPDHAALVDGARRLAEVARRVERQPLVTGTLGVHDLLEVFQYRTTGRAGLPAGLGALDLLEPHQRARVDRRLRQLWHPLHGLKLTVMTTAVKPDRVAALERTARAAAATAFPGRPVEITGHFMMLIGAASTLMETLARSLGLSALVIAGLFLLAFRSPALVLAGMVTSLIPVAGVLGLMGWAGVTMDIATVMTGSVAFGVAVDDTFHYLYHRKESGGLLRAATIAGQGIVATSLMVAGGFAVLAFSGFVPLIRFGLLTALAVMGALAVDALLLPALVGCGGDEACQRELNREEVPQPEETHA